MTVLLGISRGLVAVLCFLLLNSSARAGVPDWVKQAAEVQVAPEVLGDASAVWLVRARTSEIKSGGDIVSTVRTAMRIVSDAGTKHQTLTEYLSSRRKLTDLQGWLIKANGKDFKLDKGNRFELATDLTAGYYDDGSVFTTYFDDVEAGDLVAYEYTIRQKSFGGAYHDRFEFQVALPVHRAAYTVEIPDGWQLHTSGQFLDPVTAASIGHRYTWDATDLPYREWEPYMPDWDLVTRAVEVKAYNPQSSEKKDVDNWHEVSRWALSLHEGKTEVTDSLAGLAASLCRDAATREDSVKALAYYVRDKVRYVAIEIDKGGYEPRPADKTCANQYGDCKDKVTLLRALLKAVGISSAPLLISTEGGVDPDFPSPFQFNHVIIGIHFGAPVGFPCDSSAMLGDLVLFDPTDDRIEFGRLSNSLRGRYVLPLIDTTTTLVRIPGLTPSDNRRKYSAAISVSDSFGIEALVRVTDFGNWAAQEAYDQRTEKAEDRLNGWIKRFAKCVQDPKIDNVEHGATQDSAWTSFRLTGQNYVAHSGDLYLLKADLFHADQADELKRGARAHPVTFGSASTIETETHWQCPPDFTFEPQADTIIGDCAIASVAAYATAESTSLTYTSTLTYVGGWANPADYEQARSFVRAKLAAYRLRAVLLD